MGSISSSGQSQSLQFGMKLKRPSTRLSEGQIKRYKEQAAIPEDSLVLRDRTVKRDSNGNFWKKMPTFIIPLKSIQAEGRRNKLEEVYKQANNSFIGIETDQHVTAKGAQAKAKKNRELGWPSTARGKKVVTYLIKDPKLRQRTKDYLESNPFGDMMGEGYVSPTSTRAPSLHSEHRAVTLETTVSQAHNLTTTRPTPPPPRRSQTGTSQPTYSNPFDDSNVAKESSPLPPPPRGSKKDPFADPK